MTVVSDFLERLASGWAFGLSDLSQLWKYLLRDPTANGAQLAASLVTHIEAPEKSETDKHIPRGIREWAQQAPLDPQRKGAGEEVLCALLSTLSGWLSHPAKHSRVRILDLILAVLRGIPHEVELDADEVLEDVRAHLSDKDDRVRELTVVVLLKLVAIEEEGNARENPIIEELLDMLAYDLSQNVRAAIIMRIPLDASTYQAVLRHRTDKSAKVAAEVYTRVAKDMRLAQPAVEGGLVASPKERTSLLWHGLHGPGPEVRKAAEQLLETWFAEDAQGDVTVLLRALDPQQNPGLCNLVLERLAANDKWNAQAWLRDATAGGRSLQDLVAAAAQSDQQPGGQPSNWLAAVSPELAFAWVHACRKVDEEATKRGRAAAERVAAVAAQMEASAGAQAEGVLDAFLPGAQQMAALCMLAADAGLAHRYVASQLLEVACLPYMNWVDACSRGAAKDALWRMLTSTPGSSSAGQGPSSAASARGYLPPVSAGGDGSWEAAILRFAGEVYGGGASLVGAVLPMVLWLAEKVGLAGNQPEAVEEGHFLQVLAYLQLLMAAAGSGVPPSASADPPAEGAGPTVSLEQAVDQLAWLAGRHPAPAVRAAGMQCRVVLCLREGGLSQLPRAAAMIAPLLPAHRGSAGAAPSSSGIGAGGAADRDREAVALYQLPQRAALQGLVDLALTWGEPAVTAALRDAAARRRVEAVTAQMAGLGMEVDGGAGAEPAAEAAPVGPGDGGDGAAAQQAQGVVPMLLRLTEGVVRKLQGSDVYAEARGPAADALLGAARLLQAWSTQRKLQARLRHQVVTAMEASQAEQLLTRLLLARFSPAVECEKDLRSKLQAFWQNFRKAASAPGPDGALHRELLAGCFLHAARCAIALPAPVGAPATARGCAAPALMEFAAEVLASAAAAAAPAAAAPCSAEPAEEDGDGAGPAEADSQPAGPGPGSECALLCELVLEELTRMGSPGSASLDTEEKGVQAYASELCKTPMRLAPGLSSHPGASPAALLASVRRLAYLCRRAVDAARGSLLGGGVVTATAFKKLQEFLPLVEAMQRDNTPALTDEEAQPAIKELLARLQSLPSLDDVHAEVEADEEWDTLSGASRLAGEAGARRRGAASGARGSKATSRGAGTRRQGSKATSSRTGRSRRTDTRDAASDGDSSDGSGGASASDGDVSAAAPSRRSTGAAKAAAAPARPTASQGSMASVTASQGERRSSRAAAAKATAKMQDMKARDAVAARMERRAMGLED